MLSVVTPRKASDLGSKNASVLLIYILRLGALPKPLAKQSL